MLSLETLLREARVSARSRAQAKSILEEHGAELLREVIEALPERQKITIALRYYEALRVDEISAVLGTKEEQVRVLLEKAAQGICARLAKAQSRRARRSVSAQGGVPR